MGYNSCYSPGLWQLLDTIFSIILEKMPELGIGFWLFSCKGLKLGYADRGCRPLV